MQTNFAFAGAVGGSPALIQIFICSEPAKPFKIGMIVSDWLKGSSQPSHQQEKKEKQQHLA